MSYAGLGQISTAPAATVGRDPSRSVSGGTVRVGARWAQRAVNAGNRYNLPSAPLIAVDGRAGPITIAGLRTLSHQFSSDLPVTNDPPTSRVTDRVIIPVALETALAARAFVPDPPASRATRRVVPSTGATVPIPGATPAETPADEVILDEGSSGGLIARYGIWPWVAGGTALAGLGVWFLMGGGAGTRVRANRRHVRRNGYKGTGFKRPPRVGTRVIFDPIPASLPLYSGKHPTVGERGTVSTVAMPGGRASFMRGPGGGLVYVDWDESQFQGVSLLDLSKVPR